MTDHLNRVACHLRDQQELIVDRWRKACEQDEGLEVVHRLTREEFRNNIPGVIEALCDALTTSPREPSDTTRTEVGKHSHHRWKQGFHLRQLIRDWGHLNRVLIAVVNEFSCVNPDCQESDRSKANDRLAAFITDAVSSSVRRFDELRRAEAASIETDLTAAKRQFEELTETRGQLLREAAHDIRGGLSAIEGASTVLKLSEQADDSFNEVLEALESGVDSVKQMLDSLLDLSRLEAGADKLELLSVNIAEVIEQIVVQYGAVAANKEITLRADGPKELWVRTDASKVSRIAQNLVVNALQHTTSGEVRLTWMPEADAWLLMVSDTGPGIQDVVGSPTAQELDGPDLDRETSDLNKPHACTGEGIGLMIAKRLCDLLDARISLESEAGKGTTFTVQFPNGYGQA